jgi:hypothetical protein
MTTLANLVDRTISEWLEPNRRHAMTKLSTAVSTADVVLTMSYPAGISRGTILSIGGEDIMVWAFDTVASQTTDVLRGYRGSTPTSHAASSLVELNTRFPRSRVLQTLKEEIDGWGADLYQVVPASVTGIANQSWVDLTVSPSITTCYGIIDARIRRNNVGVVEGTVSSYDRWPRLNAKLARNMPVANFPSGLGLRVGEILTGPANIRLLVAMPFNTLSFTESTDLSLIGLPDSYADVACLGAACRLLWGQEADRTDRSSAGEMRRAQEVTVGQTYQQGSMLERSYTRRLDAEKAKLLSQFPIRIM